MSSTHLTNQEAIHSYIKHLVAGRKKQAQALLRRVITERPETAFGFTLLTAGMLAQNGQPEEAVPIYAEAIRLDPDHPDPYFYMGVAYHTAGKDKECTEVWDHLSKKFPGHATDHYQKALRLLIADKAAEAETELYAALDKLEPPHPLREDALATIRAIQEAANDTTTPADA